MSSAIRDHKWHGHSGRAWNSRTFSAPSDNISMACFSCGNSAFRSISSAMAKAASARWRAMGGGQTAVNWSQRAAICETCPMRVVSRGTSYCGTPFLQQIDRDPVQDGCGCPTRDKAMSPNEHCPVDRKFQLPIAGDGGCNCRWCAGTSVKQAC